MMLSLNFLSLVVFYNYPLSCRFSSVESLKEINVKYFSLYKYHYKQMFAHSDKDSFYIKWLVSKAFQIDVSLAKDLWFY